MISPDEKLSIHKQVRLLKISRSSFYYHQRPVSVADLKLMRQIDELHLELSWPRKVGQGYKWKNQLPASH